MVLYQPQSQPTAAQWLWDCCRELGAVFRYVVACSAAWVGTAIVNRYHDRKRVYELRSISDRTLKDIGIHRSEILFVVHGKRFNPEERRYEIE